MLRYALIALIAVVSAEDAITVTQSNPVPASATVSCNAGNTLLQGHTLGEAVSGAATNSGATNEHLVTISHGRCKLELKPTHANAHAGATITEGHIFHIDGAVVDPALDSADHNGYFETQYEDRTTPGTGVEECDMDSHNRVEFQPVIVSNGVTSNLQVTVILSAITSNGESWTSQDYQSGYEFKQYYDDALLTATGTNYADNSDSWQKVVNMAVNPASDPDAGGSTVVFTWASGCDAPVSSTCESPFTTDITCTHLVNSITNPKGLIKATHSTVQGHTKHKCWVDHAEPNALTNAAACKCQCVP